MPDDFDAFMEKKRKEQIERDTRAERLRRYKEEQIKLKEELEAHKMAEKIKKLQKEKEQYTTKGKIIKAVKNYLNSPKRIRKSKTHSNPFCLFPQTKKKKRNPFNF